LYIAVAATGKQPTYHGKYQKTTKVSGRRVRAQIMDWLLDSFISTRCLFSY